MQQLVANIDTSARRRWKINAQKHSFFMNYALNDFIFRKDVETLKMYPIGVLLALKKINHNYSPQ